MRSTKIIPLMAVLFFALALPVQAEVSADQRSKIDKASDVLENALARTEGGIPKEVINQAQGVAVIPDVVKGAFLVGGRYGEGLLVVRTDKDSWSGPAFISLTGASLGAQAGAEVSDLVLVFNSQKGVDALRNGKLSLGGDIAVLAGPVGGKADLQETLRPDADVFAYSRSEGVFAGLSIKGSVIQFDDDANAMFYGKESVKPETIFAGGQANASMKRNEFTCLVARVTNSSPTC